MKITTFKPTIQNPMTKIIKPTTQNPMTKIIKPTTQNPTTKTNKPSTQNPSNQWPIYRQMYRWYLVRYESLQAYDFDIDKYQAATFGKIWNQRATLTKDHKSNNQFTCKYLFFYKIPGCDLYHSNLAAHKFSLMQTLILGGDPLTEHCILPAELT